MPTTLAQIGLRNPERGQIRVAAVKACAPAEGIHHEAGRITPDKVLDAMLMADCYGKSRQRAILGREG